MGSQRSPHDALFRHTFSQPEHATGLLKSQLPQALVAAVDWDSLSLQPGSFVDEALRWRHTDLLFRADIAGHPGFLYLLVEHQSTAHALMPLRVMQYVMRIWEAWLRDNPKATKLPAVLPLVVYHGRPPWNEARSLGDLIDLEPPLREALRALLPELKLVIDDLSEQSEDEVRMRALSRLGALTMLCLRSLPHSKTPLDDLHRLLALCQSVAASPRGVDALAAILKYLFEVLAPERAQLKQLLAPLGPEVEARMTTIADQLRQEGEVTGRAATLLKQLQLKFGPLPPTISERVQSAAIADLDRWAERILSASTLDEALG